jgi:hypothetical protein
VGGERPPSRTAIQPIASAKQRGELESWLLVELHEQVCATPQLHDKSKVGLEDDNASHHK